MTVTGIMVPSARNICVIPIFLPKMAFFMVTSGYLQFDLDVDARGEIELHERVHSLAGRLKDVDQALMRSHLELFARIFIFVRRAQNGYDFGFRRQGDRSADLRAGSLGGFNDFVGALVDQRAFLRLELNANSVCHII